ncbi:terminase large subunit [Erysipelothrix aquatica]|uniref:terminase large subunit n=1 Tax=Erysipelothrix aquatica TaxID=2683714 RepID=UPI00135BC99B|nr:terminase large subunit [Erysipelothrix aquatica]
MAKKGSQKPTQSIILSAKNSLFEDAVNLYEKSGRKARQWQINLLKAILSRNKKGLWEHTKFGWSISRRNGKNEVVAQREMIGIVMLSEKILHTAHRTTASHEAWERLTNLLDSAEIEYESLRASGRERITISGGGKIEFRTRSSKGGLGEGFDVLVIDEAQEYTDDQESALKYVISASENPQTLFCGTPPTPHSSGTVFTNLRNNTLAKSVKNAGWAEWSVPEQTDPYDKKAWYATNPSLGQGLTERSIEDEIGNDVIDFNVQRLGLWLKYNQKSAISEADWESVKVEKLPIIKGKLFVGIKYGVDGTNVALSIAVKTEDNRVFVESIDCKSIRHGTGWILDFIKKSDVEKVVIDGAGAQNILAQDMKEYRIKNPVLPTVKEVIIANSSFERSLYQDKLCHLNQPSLTQVIVNCEKRNIGTNGGFGYRSQFEENDISLMDSVILAHWACIESKPVAPQKIRY